MLLDPARSLVDFAFYREASKHSLLRAGAYLLYVGFLFAVFATAIVYLRVQPLLREATDWLASSMPVITIEGGKASASAPGPVVLRMPRDKRFGVMIDTGRSGPVTFDELAKQEIAVAITQDSVYVVVPDRGRLEQRAFSGMKTAKLVVDAAFYRSVGGLLTQAIALLLVPMFWVLFFLWKLLASLFYAVVGFLLSEAGSGGLDFATTYKLAIYAQTPWILLQAVMLPLNRMIPLPVLFVMGLAVTSAYLWKAVGQCKADGNG